MLKKNPKFDSIRINKRRKGKNRMKKLKNSQKGITLVALVVTIIVLIILAAISINLVLGENRNTKKSKRWKRQLCSSCK